MTGRGNTVGRVADFISWIAVLIGGSNTGLGSFGKKILSHNIGMHCHIPVKRSIIMLTLHGAVGI